MRPSEREELLRCIDTTSFAIDDVTLYLDTHPTDKAALEYYAKVNALRKQAIKDYTTYFGPLMIDDVNTTNIWSWVQDPWPWEMER
ncbi:spore coat protein CotJB [Cellulosilyticum sp. I15G10I2]|uniref:spore coat protein CotJB n=1 Tax=Cellulosilyticum sp. I15G10I2 TaxID=1892843 RepID=UPI00085CA6E5|nr:spore coat protein CotJB [Cellulosilyticum sp. I15G10I2]